MSDKYNAYIKKFDACLSLLAKAAEELHLRNQNAEVILVGGAVVSFYTDGLFMSGDFELQTLADVEFLDILTEFGFLEETKKGRLKNRYYHPDHPTFGVQILSGWLMDGYADRKKLVTLKVDKQSGIKLLSVEDMIADRLGQFEANPNDESRLNQAKALFSLTTNIDMQYLERRILEEGSNINRLGIANDAKHRSDPGPK